MDAARAQQIIESDQVIEVLHEGSPVWIEKVKKDVPFGMPLPVFI